MAAFTYRRAHGPTVKQRNAIEFLVAGLNDSAVAERVGVNRNTVNRWRLYDPAFQVALTRRRATLLAGATDELRAIIPLALDSLREQLEGGPRRDRLALDLLSRMGLLGARGGAPGVDPLDIGPASIEEILDAEVHRARAASSASAAAGDPEAPVTEAERDEAYARLITLAGESDPGDNEDAPAPPDLDSSWSATVSTSGMGAFS